MEPAEDRAPNWEEAADPETLRRRASTPPAWEAVAALRLGARLRGAHQRAAREDARPAPVEAGGDGRTTHAALVGEDAAP